MALEAPDDPRAWTEDKSYFLGSTFLVAPVMESGATQRTLYLPPGEWVDYWRGTVYEGGREVTVPAPLDPQSGPPVFARAGSIVPLAPDYDTLVPGSTPGLKTYAGDLVVRVMPSGPAGPREASFTLYDGTLLHWDGQQLAITNNPRARSVELRAPDGSIVQQQVDGATATLAT
jgi:alpha-glucosidase (family GH31 glycosyl hydrolase)